MDTPTTYTAFAGQNLFTKGTLSEVIKKIKKNLGKSHNSSFLIFCDNTGKTVDFNFHGTEKDIQRRLDIFVDEKTLQENTGPGRPKMGVVSREVSLLPRHWEWLATQSGGASATLRLLVEQAKKKSEGGNFTKMAQEKTYKFMSIMAGDLAGYEEALRALYKKDEKKFSTQIAGWPDDIRQYSNELSRLVFKEP